eukprot:gnl/MRDRNA2_/MRDRNA2_70076_c0_seq2.p1 gnl/MRDRNA2_/MRDRNA2_70076_c0~~gnl/MRDRNA2_/MRDRNA2_70076_c0_seq2.p1  ORF type:complete len:440 (-),score=56.95 gnl/MRDRNA2_/MRDRNA2_70076_c0_seq2:12-1331(-)
MSVQTSNVWNSFQVIRRIEEDAASCIQRRWRAWHRQRAGNASWALWAALHDGAKRIHVFQARSSRSKSRPRRTQRSWNAAWSESWSHWQSAAAWQRSTSMDRYDTWWSTPVGPHEWDNWDSSQMSARWNEKNSGKERWKINDDNEPSRRTLDDIKGSVWSHYSFGSSEHGKTYRSASSKRSMKSGNRARSACKNAEPRWVPKRQPTDQIQRKDAVGENHAARTIQRIWKEFRHKQHSVSPAQDVGCEKAVTPKTASQDKKSFGSQVDSDSALGLGKSIAIEMSQMRDRVQGAKVVRSRPSAAKSRSPSRNRVTNPRLQDLNTSGSKYAKSASALDSRFYETANLRTIPSVVDFEGYGCRRSPSPRRHISTRSGASPGNSPLEGRADASVNQPANAESLKHSEVLWQRSLVQEPHGAPLTTYYKPQKISLYPPSRQTRWQ